MKSKKRVTNKRKIYRKNKKTYKRAGGLFTRFTQGLKQKFTPKTYTTKSYQQPVSFLEKDFYGNEDVDLQPRESYLNYDNEDVRDTRSFLENKNEYLQNRSSRILAAEKGEKDYEDIPLVDAMYNENKNNYLTQQYSSDYLKPKTKNRTIRFNDDSLERTITYNNNDIPQQMRYVGDLYKTNKGYGGKRKNNNKKTKKRKLNF